jgi:hypothetical protein
MNTEDFIGALSRQTPPPAPKRAMLAVYGLIGLALAGVVFIAIGGVRADLGAAWLSTTLKMSFGALAAIAFLPILNRVIGQNHRILDAAFGVGGVLVLAVLVSAIGLAATDTTLRSTRWTVSGKSRSSRPRLRRRSCSRCAALVPHGSALPDSASAPWRERPPLFPIRCSARSTSRPMSRPGTRRRLRSAR